MSMMGRSGAAAKGQVSIQTLVQSNGQKPAIVDKSWDEVGLLTDYMGDCDSAVLLYQKAITHNKPLWNHMRGHHASGGHRAFNFKELFKGITPSSSNLLVIVQGRNPSAMCEYDVERYLAEVGQSVTDLIIYKDISNALISNNSVVYEWDKIVDKSVFNVRISPEAKALWSM